MVKMKFKRKKNSRQRGSKTHGWGAMKKHRGAGNRGGRGNAGTGKRADAKKPNIWSNKKYFGKYGFSSKKLRKPKSLNFAYIEHHFNALLKKGLISESSGVFVVDLGKIGYDKLLAKGKLSRPYKILCKEATENAVKKVEQAGGSVEIKKKQSKEDSGDNSNNTNKSTAGNDSKQASKESKDDAGKS